MEDGTKKEINVNETRRMTDDWVIVTIVTLVIVIFWAIAIWYILKSLSTVSTATGGHVYINCPVGQCATNRFNGEKRCPAIDGTIVSDATIEVCSNRYICDNPSLPYSINSDGSTNITGQCENNTICRCSSTTTCPNYIVSFFKNMGGNPYYGIDGTKTNFQQYNTWTDTYTGIVSNATPLHLNNTATEFCSIPIQWITHSTPGCPVDDIGTSDSIIKCMSYQKGYAGITYKPCMSGTLALIMDDSSKYNNSQIARYPLGCVAAEPCDSGLLAIWDIGYNGLVCKNTTLS